MNKEIKENIMNHYRENVPNEWNLIKKRIAKELATNLLKSLEHFSDPQGKELIDFREEYLSKINKMKRIGA